MATAQDLATMPLPVAWLFAWVAVGLWGLLVGIVKDVDNHLRHRDLVGAFWGTFFGVGLGCVAFALTGLSFCRLTDVCI